MQVLIWRCKKKSAKQLSDKNADSQVSEKSAKQLSDENADLQAQEKSAKQLSDENADLITIKYTLLQLLLLWNCRCWWLIYG